VIPPRASTFVGLATGGADLTVQFYDGDEHDELGAHAQVFRGGTLAAWDAGSSDGADLCVHLPEGGADWLVHGAPDQASVADVRMHLPGAPPSPMPPGDLSVAPDIPAIPAGTLVIQHIEHGTPFGVAAIRQHFVDGVPIAFEWGLGEAHVVVNVQYREMLAYRMGEIDLLEAVRVGRIEGATPMVSLAAGLVVRPEYRAYLATNAALCATVARWSEHVVTARWQAAQTLERTRGGVGADA